MEAKGWNFGYEGEFLVPKTLSIYVLDKKSLTETFKFEASIERVSLDLTPQAIKLTTERPFYPYDNGSREGELDEIRRELQFLRMNDVPVGTIIAFAGDLAKIGNYTEGGRWLLCDGRPIPVAEYNAYKELINVIDKIWNPDGKTEGYYLPDLQGRFIRGFGGNSLPIGKKQDFATNHKSAKLSSDVIVAEATRFFPQYSSVGLPEAYHHANFIDSRDLRLGNIPSNNGGYFSILNNKEPRQHQYTIRDSFPHNLKINEGDSETRPDNVAVYYLIKAKP